MVMTIVWTVVPFVITGALAFVVAWNRAHRFEGCCPPPARGAVWVCGHRKAWERVTLASTQKTWRKCSRRRYIRLAMPELMAEIRKTRSG